MNNKNPEILAPGGDFNSALHAFESGADAVYLGLQSYSARKRAKNFTLDDLRRLKTFCFENNKKIYVALNTLLKDDEIENIYPLLKQLEEIEVDAVIVQDLGLAYIIKENTNLVLHGSTQLAAHNIDGVIALKNMGFSRVVLSRELSLNEIDKIKKTIPEMELEVFIHGALCYGFSGLCLASSKLIGRSANRGECGQICRTWFNNSGKKEYCFSMNDLSLKENIIKLKEIGVESLKIEGRMKGPNYAASTSELYYKILNNKKYNEVLKRTEIDFNRSGQDIYLTNRERSGRINVQYPGHLGRVIGEIRESKNNTISVETDENIENRDGLMILSNIRGEEPYKFSANILEKTKGKYILKTPLPKNSQKTLYKISNHDKHLKEEKSTKFKPWKKDIELQITVKKESIIIIAAGSKFTYPIELERAKNPTDLNQLFKKVFYPGGETNYYFSSIVKSNFEQPFIPISKLKEIRNKFQEDFLKSIQNITNLEIEENVVIRSYLKNSNKLPFITRFKDVELNTQLKEDGNYLLPLAPVIFDSERYLLELKEFLEEHRNKKFIIGLNNIGHINFINQLNPKLSYYCDYGLFAINRYSRKYLSTLIPNLKWVTKWVEEDNILEYPPIFISRTCFKAQMDGCPTNCKKEFDFKVNQNGNKTVIVRDCITYTFNESTSK
ncbi:U32 family peptidase [Thiospirochaeta perfilievii]|uniref:U32 family peptidase n=1 Tax=Thiospirochaeta perfilievii TaxID=252967 RepID=A0A5C1QC52_9SPIO|nr:U32 family peptidase [Thiospirochaeta perfilievii]QEN04489.1 U32 family peptidase [Thiospirochaeta perfilievii]